MQAPQRALLCKWDCLPARLHIIIIILILILVLLRFICKPPAFSWPLFFTNWVLIGVGVPNGWPVTFGSVYQARGLACMCA